MYKERRETTHGEIGEKQHTSSYIYMKIKAMYVINNGHKTSVQEDNVTKKKK